MKSGVLVSLVALAVVATQQSQSHAQQRYVLPQMKTHILPVGYSNLNPEANNLLLAAFKQQLSDDASGYAEADCTGSQCEGCSSCCATKLCAWPKWQFFAEALYMRARDAEVVYGVPFNGPVTSPPDPPIQVGRTGVVDFDYEPAFRVGYSGAVGDCATVGVTYSYFQAATADDIHTQAPYVIRSMVAHPSTLAAASDGLDAVAQFSMDYDLIDADYRRVFSCSPLHTMNYLVGARYANLNQDFSSQYAVNGLETVTTNINFEGGGIRLGLEGERYARCSGWMIYGNAAASFVAGEFRGQYAQGQAFDASVVDTSWKAGRIVSMLDLEVGVGWTSCSGRLRMTAGYFVSGWFNTVKTDEFIQAVKTNNFIDLGDRLTFDGLSVRGELRF